MTVARLAVSMYTAERRVRIDNAYSDPVTPTRGFIAGCSNALAAITATMIRHMDSFVSRNPGIDVDIYVDDIEMQAVGSREAVVNNLAAAVRDMEDTMVNKLGYPLAEDKAVVVASKADIAHEISSVTDGRAGTAHVAAEKLGIEFTCGAKRRRRGGPRRARYNRQIARRRRLGKLKSLGGKIIQVVRRGQQPAATYGSAVHGVSDHELEILRAMTSAALPPSTRGTSRTLKLLVAGDPAVNANSSVLLQWAGAAWRACGPAAQRRRTDPTPVLMDAALKKAEAAIRKDGEGKWSSVTGPATAAVMTARRIGWMFISGFRLSDERGEIIDLAITDPASVRVAVERASTAEAATRAAVKEAIDGDASEVWVAPVRRALASRLTPAARSSLRRAFAGGYWTNSHRAEQGMCQSSLCDKCGCGPDDRFHRIYECTALDRLRGDYTTVKMREHAALATRDDPYWTRGLTSNPWRSLAPPQAGLCRAVVFRARRGGGPDLRWRAVHRRLGSAAPVFRGETRRMGGGAAGTRREGREGSVWPSPRR